jgi:hypothetical protein
MEDTPKKRMGRPPLYDRESLLKERLTVLVTREQKEYILTHGGAEYIRRLVEEDRGRQTSREANHS